MMRPKTPWRPISWRWTAIDGIELDIHLSADGRIVCVHDADLKRVAGVPAVIAEHTLAELRQIHHMPELHEVLAILRPGCVLQIELKSSAPHVIGKFGNSGTWNWMRIR